MKGVRLWLRSFGAAALAAAALSCMPPATGGGAAGSAPKEEVITREAIAATGASTVWDALRWTYRRVSYTTDSNGRPLAIRARGRSSIRTDDGLMVVVDGIPIPDIAVLGQMSARTVERIEILSGIDASTRFGTNAGDGVIHIITRSH